MGISLFIYSFSFFYLFFFFFLFLSFSFFTFSYIFLRSFVFLEVIYDEYFLFINFVLLVVMAFSSLYRINLAKLKFSFLLILLSLVVCFIVFSSTSLLLVYLNYELSIIPIILIIIIWGSYPERSLSSIILLIYTSIFTIPFLIVLWICFLRFSTFSFVIYSYLSSYLFSSSFFISLLVFIVFAVKLPLYGIHFWLPIAHVEAPTFGSIILAGVLLKLGGIGLIRCLPIIHIPSLSLTFRGYLFFMLVYSTSICSMQSDFKRIVAYSSVSHMIVIPILLLGFNALSAKAIIMCILFHGLSSPLLFSLVGYIYSIFKRRQLIVIRGLLIISPLLTLFLVLGFIFSISIPPFASFLGEAYFFICSFSL